jgi:hypothetical protein
MNLPWYWCCYDLLGMSIKMKINNESEPKLWRMKIVLEKIRSLSSSPHRFCHFSLDCRKNVLSIRARTYICALLCVPNKLHYDIGGDFRFIILRNTTINLFIQMCPCVCVCMSFHSFTQDFHFIHNNNKTSPPSTFMCDSCEREKFVSSER